MIIKQTTGKKPFLTFQVGRMDKRPARLPIYRDDKIVGHKESSMMVEVFTVLGFGSTLAAAENMAATASF